MEEKIIRRLYLKIILAGVAGMTLCVVSSFLAGMWSTLWLDGLVLVAVIGIAFSIRRDIKSGNVVSVYAECYESIGAKSFFKTTTNSRTTYRFITKSINSIQCEDNDDDDSSTSIYIKSEHGKFRDGELYCILFRKSSDNSYSERNLLAYGAVQLEVMSFVADADIDKPTDMKEKPVSNLQEENINFDNEKLVFFKPRDKNE